MSIEQLKKEIRECADRMMKEREELVKKCKNQHEIEACKEAHWFKYKAEEDVIMQRWGFRGSTWYRAKNK